MRPFPQSFESLTCAQCRSGVGLDFGFTMAFQPIVNLRTRQVFAQEALVRGLQGEPAGFVLDQVTDQNRYQFDQACRVKAIETASRVGVDSLLSINFFPNAVYRAETCIRATLQAAKEFGFPLQNILFEVTEGEKALDVGHLREIVTEYKRQGFKTAIDDFGAGYAGLNLLADFQPDIVKLDMLLLRNIDQDPVRQAIVRGVVGLCRELKIEIIAEGVETEAELRTLWSFGIELYQGFYFARPAFESLASVNWPGEL